MSEISEYMWKIFLHRRTDVRRIRKFLTREYADYARNLDNAMSDEQRIELIMVLSNLEATLSNWVSDYRIKRFGERNSLESKKL